MGGSIYAMTNQQTLRDVSFAEGSQVSRSLLVDCISYGCEGQIKWQEMPFPYIRRKTAYNCEEKNNPDLEITVVSFRGGGTNCVA